jgi:hypothetical protein
MGVRIREEWEDMAAAAAVAVHLLVQAAWVEHLEEEDLPVRISS